MARGIGKPGVLGVVCVLLALLAAACSETPNSHPSDSGASGGSDRSVGSTGRSSPDASGGGGSGGAAGVGDVSGLGGSTGTGGTTNEGDGGAGTPLPAAPSCAVAGGSANVTRPELLLTLYDRWDEGWLGSAAIADLDRDGRNEIVLPRGDKLYAFNDDGTIRWKVGGLPGRIWASPVVADFRGDAALEVAFASRGEIHMVDADGDSLSGFPVEWINEMRSIGAGDVDGDGGLDIVVATTRGGGGKDVVSAFDANGVRLAGFPPIASGASGCEIDDRCYLAGAFDQNLGVGDLDDDGYAEIVVPQDNAYTGIYRGTGEVFDTHSDFPSAKVLGVRYLHDLALAQQGYPDRDADLQAHFTNTAPAIADIDGDGSYEIVMLGSVQNAAQDNRLQGVALWGIRSDASRLRGFEVPLHVPEYLSGLWDYGSNIVAISCQVSVADIDAASAGLELIFPGFDGQIHAVGATGAPLWQYRYTSSDSVMTGGVVVGDLSGDGSPEIVFNTYSTDNGRGALVILDAAGTLQHEIPLPRRGAMAVPTLGDVDGNGEIEILVSLKDAEDRVESALVYTVPGSSDNCLLWPTGRANLLRNGWVRRE